MSLLFDTAFIGTHLNYWLFVILMMTGLYIVVARGNLLKKVVGLNLFQASVFMLYISMSKIAGGTAPIEIPDPNAVYSSPLPHVLILTAIVVGVATTALALALIVRINEAYGTIEEDEVLEIDRAKSLAETAREDERDNEEARAV
jgi:multicomponent Na+:H+ antiporter subunit C